jgi:hypothetical protein
MRSSERLTKEYADQFSNTDDENEFLSKYTVSSYSAKHEHSKAWDEINNELNEVLENLDRYDYI